jgi:chemotaxis protein methyltransferase CheR
MKPDDFTYFSKWLKDRTGLVLGTDKMYLIESRLTPLLRKWNMGSFDSMMAALRKGDDAVQREVSDAMMTHESFFYRDIKPFELFKRDVLPRLLATRAARRSMRIWSAACSTGQEPYTLAMILKEEGARLAGWKIDIVATDIAREIIDRAKQGVYTQFEVQRGLPIQMLMKYFKQNGDKWQISQEIRNMVQYREFNLLADPRVLGTFDVVFCRNVLIYFDQVTKGGVLMRVARAMEPDGVLYLGGAETVIGICDAFAPLPGERGVYGLVGGAAAGVTKQAAIA